MAQRQASLASDGQRQTSTAMQATSDNESANDPVYGAYPYAIDFAECQKILLSYRESGIMPHMSSISQPCFMKYLEAVQESIAYQFPVPSLDPQQLQLAIPPTTTVKNAPSASIRK